MKNEITDFLLRLLFPDRCIVCRRFISKGYICEDCMGEETAVTRSLNIQRGQSSRLMKIYTPHRYVGSYRRSIHRLKFGGVSHNAVAVARFIVDRVPDEAFEKADLITFVPLSKEVYRQRGYNQAELIAKELPRLKNIPVKAVLVKIKQNRPQHSLSAKDRARNVKGVFVVEADIKGQNIILVDDIITTGETMNECSKLLFRAGAESVTGICAASAD